MTSRLLQVAKEVHTRVMGKEAKVYAIHAGLECGLIQVRVCLACSQFVLSLCLMLAYVEYQSIISICWS